jgi:hypothetical protein
MIAPPKVRALTFAGYFMGQSQADEKPSKTKAVAGVVIIAAIAVAVFVGRDSTTGGTTFDPATVTCDNGSLTNQAKGLIEGSTSPLLGKVSILKATNYRQNSAYGKQERGLSQYGSMSQKEIRQDMMADRKHQCAADLITSRGKMTMYYGWKTIDGAVYIESLTMPSLD